MTVQKYLVKHNDRSVLIHYDGAFQPGDVAFCGADLMGDGLQGANGWHRGVETNRKVNCNSCIQLLAHAKSIIKENKE